MQQSLPEWFKWLTLGFIIAASIAVIIGAVNLAPSSAQAGQVESEVLAKQLEFILKMNSAFLGFLGIIGALLTWFFKNNLEDAKVVASKMVKDEVEQYIQARVREEFRYWEMSAQTERVVGQTLVNYYVPGGGDEPHEFSLIKSRGFRQVLFCSRLEEVSRSAADVVIFDVYNWKTGGGDRISQLKPNSNQLTDESQQKVREQIDLLESILANDTVLVVYVRGVVHYLNDPKFACLYLLPVNNQVTLLGATVNGAYVSHGDRTTQRN